MKFLKNQFIFFVFILISNTIVGQQNTQSDLKKKRTQIQMGKWKESNVRTSRRTKKR